MRTRGLRITSLLVASPVVLILLSLIFILLLSICSQIRIWISAIANSIGFANKATPSNILASNSPLYHGVSTNQFSSLDSKTIASVDKISLNAPGSGSAWMHRLTQYLRMMPLRFAASSTILLAIIILICIFAFRIARHKIRGQDAYETCMEKLAEYRIPGTMYINTKKFHEFLKATEKQPTIRRWQLSKESSRTSEANNPSLPTHTQQEHSMFRVHRTGLTRPRSRSNGSSTPNFDRHSLRTHTNGSFESIRLEEKAAQTIRNNTFASQFLSEDGKHMQCNQQMLDDRQEDSLCSSSDETLSSEIKSNIASNVVKQSAGSPSATSKILLPAGMSDDENISYQLKMKSNDVSEVTPLPVVDDSKDVFVQVERKKKKKVKVATRSKPQQPLPSPRASLEIAKPTGDSMVECEPRRPEDATTWTSSPTIVISPPMKQEPDVQHVKEELPASQAQVEETQANFPTVSSPPACAKSPYQEYTGAWYSPFSSGLQLDILPRSRTPQPASYNEYPAASYGQFSGITMNYRKHYQQSSLPYISRTSSPRSLVGRERLLDHSYISSHGGYGSPNTLYSTESSETPYGMERRRWTGINNRSRYNDPEINSGDNFEFSLFDKKLPGN